MANTGTPITRSEILAEALYAMTITAKRTRFRWRSERYRYTKLLSQMQYVLHAMALERITDSRCDVVLHAAFPKSEDFENRFRESEQCSHWSETQKDLLLTMQGIVSVCIPVLLHKQGEYIGTIRCSVGALHNLARAFLPASDYMHISVEDALEYTRPYWNRLS